MAPGAVYAAFIDETGTGELVHLNDEAGDLWQRFGTSGRSTFMFVNNDETFLLSTYGAMDEGRLTEEVERLIAS